MTQEILCTNHHHHNQLSLQRNLDKILQKGDLVMVAHIVKTSDWNIAEFCEVCQNLRNISGNYTIPSMNSSRIFRNFQHLYQKYKTTK